MGDNAPAGLLPSQFLSVVLEESDRSARKAESNNKSNGSNSSSTIKDSWENSSLTEKYLKKHLPPALLAECTVEIARGHDSIKKKKESFRWEEPRKKKMLPPVPGLQRIAFEEEKSLDIRDIMNRVEAVYSDEEEEIGFGNGEIEMRIISKKGGEPRKAVSLTPVKPILEMKAMTSDPKLISNADSKAGAAGVDRLLYRCEYCCNAYNNRGALWQHTVATHSTEKTCECKICGRKFYRNCSLALHLKSHSDEQRCTCVKCGKSFGRLSTLDKHMKMFHEEFSFCCRVCNEKFGNYEHFLRHSATHGPQGKEGDKGNLNCIIKNLINSNTSVLYSCEFCSLSFKKKELLDSHIILVHSSNKFNLNFFKNNQLIPISGDKPHVCKVCGKSYSHRSVLRKHMFIHSGLKTKCVICGIQFTQKSSLLRHVKRMHPDVQIGNGLEYDSFPEIKNGSTENSEGIKEEDGFENDGSISTEMCETKFEVDSDEMDDYEINPIDFLSPD